mmetsp:Transcript_50403/g.60631  ORF Transcript_50403/g.60631 Transcript_50403/m.60631 type:complete len:276 (-) Transcript_50403:34-861(-)
MSHIYFCHRKKQQHSYPRLRKKRKRKKIHDAYFFNRCHITKKIMLSFGLMISFSILPNSSVNGFVRGTAHTKSIAKMYTDCSSFRSNNQISMLPNENIILEKHLNFLNYNAYRTHYRVKILHGNNDDDSFDEAKTSKTNGRVGGRVPLSCNNRNSQFTKEPDVKTPFQFLKAWGSALLGFWVGLQILKLVFFGSFGGGSDVVYYSSSYYESRTVDSAGQVQVNRKEEFRSNIPGLNYQIDKGKVNNDAKQPVLPNTSSQSRRSFVDDYISQQKDN